MGVAGQDDTNPQVDDNPDLETDPPNDEPPANDPPQADDPPQDPPAGGDDDEEDVVQIGTEEPPASEEHQAAPKWVKELRERQRQLAKENAELKAKLSGNTVSEAPKLPEKPRLADVDYDEEKYQEALDGWYAKKREVEAHEAKQQEQVKAQQERVRKLNEAYTASKAALKVKNFDEAEEAVAAAFEEWQQSIVKVGPTNPGAMVFALGMTPKKLQELASIKDPVKFAVAIGRLETEVKVTKRTSTKPAPETTLRSNTSASSSTATLERLRAEADKTGDRSKVAAYLRQQSKAGK